MNFERGKDPKESLSVGLSAATFILDRILIIRYDKSPSRIRLTENACHKVLKIFREDPEKFLKNCQSNKRAFGFVEMGDRDFNWIMENLLGEIVRYKDNLYVIPKI